MENVETPQGQAPEQNNEGATADQNVNELHAQIASLRKESASYRTKAKALETQLSTLQSAPAEAESRIAALESQLTQMRESALDVAISANAMQMGFHDPSLAMKLIDRSNLKPDDTSAIAQSLAELAKSSPFLVRNQRTDAADYSAGDANPVSAANDWLRKQAGM